MTTTTNIMASPYFTMYFEAIISFNPQNNLIIMKLRQK